MKTPSNPPQNQQGFSLIELMITVAIIGILAAIVYPSYQNHVIKANRTEGQAVMMGILSQQQNFFARNMIYTDDLAKLGFGSASIITKNGRYSIKASVCGAPYIKELSGCVKLTATAKTTQVSDGNLTINSAGVKTPPEKW